PQIFKLKEIGDEAFRLLGMGSRRAKTYVEIDNYAQVAEAFREQLHAMFDRLFDPEVEIERAADDGCCKFCNFKALCH
ncbi:MAG: PD-(D/E)XK nuclease family protein, partial [Muribaculaceae bacterium]|nr:PD-(D/E)XK nuclease family protein [Muribaculaceae bacterium]